MIYLNTYEQLLQDADDAHVTVHEAIDLNGDTASSKRLDGLYIDNHIALDSQLKTTAEKTAILAEEIGHHFTSVGDITDLKDAADSRNWTPVCGDITASSDFAELSVLSSITARIAMRWPNIWMCLKITWKKPCPVIEVSTVSIRLLTTIRFTLFRIYRL